MDDRYSVSDMDIGVFSEELDGFLPGRIFDAHCHIALREHFREISEERKRKLWALNCPHDISAEEFFSFYGGFFPGREVRSICFGFPTKEAMVDRQNAYLEAASKGDVRLNPLYLATPDMDEEELSGALERGFVGFKPYPDFVADKAPSDVRIPDFVTPAICDVADRYGAIVIVHIPGPRRLADPANIADLLELKGRYPNVRLIVAHLGRSYNPIYLREGLDQLGGEIPWHFDFSAVMNVEVFRIALSEIPSGKLLYGSDLPILAARGYRTWPSPRSYMTHIVGYNCEGDYPPLLYQELMAFRDACGECGISRGEVEDILWNNAFGLLREAVEGIGRRIAHTG